MQEMQIWSLDLEDPLEKETATHSSIVAWRIPWTEKATLSMGLQKSDHDLATKQQVISLVKDLQFLLKGYRYSSEPYLVSCLIDIYWNLHQIEEVSYTMSRLSVQFSSAAQLCPTLCNPRLQHARLSCPSATPGAYSTSCPLSQWCHPTISPSVIPFSSYLCHQVAKLLVSASASVLQWISRTDLL